ncbi:Pleiotropic ABC efflux transporter of multiple drugs YBT1 [Exophiala dermatitidis]
MEAAANHQQSTTSLAISISCLLLVTALSIPALSQCISRARAKKDQYQSLTEHYEDEDGIATAESEERFSDFIQRLLLIVLSVVVCLDALATAILTTTRPQLSLSVQQWFQFATWLLLLFQAVSIFITPSSRKRYDLGVFSGLSAFFIALAVVLENLSLWRSRTSPLPRDIHLTLSIVQIVCGLLLVLTSFLIPRRPDVYWNGKPVDRENTVSVLEKLTFSWSSPILSHAVKNRGLDYDDLPEIGHQVRSRELRQRFEAVGKKDKLWKTLFFSHKWAFIQQWVYQALCSVTNFLPQVALFFILRTLEARDQGEDVAFRSWLLVFGLGGAITFSSWLESWMFYVVFLRLCVPVYEQLSAVVFGKAMRRKDVKGAGPKDEEETTANGDVQLNGDAVVNENSGLKGEDRAPAEDEDEDFQKSKQSTINLVGVDSKRIADFATFNYIFLGAVVNLIFAFVFLTKLIGPIPLLAGMAAPIIITPINIIAARRYANAQDDLMKLRDQKMAVVTEALQGIRQIKFSALEKNWYEKILESRRKELKTQWQVFVYDTTLISIWIFGPVMLAAISLTTYAVINKELTASVAFTTISVYEAIEMTLAVIPEMVTELLDAIVSARRVQEYLDAPEREETTKPGETVAFKNATIIWPSDDPKNEADQFALRNLNLEFPKNELSVISGRTGSGKSLLLASIIGEADVLEGEVVVPKPPSPAERYDALANKSNWIIPSAIAYVSQIPWIENATIRDNILFGLPFDNDRYQKVLHSCALTKDLEMLQDGELTDIGANGINLSGGQKWRVSFARALYSRAGILVLDDIFSAVDAHVGRHLFEQALTGELGQGRTRILVTHHVALCLPKTSYSVLLSNGTVEEAGPTEELRRSGKLGPILAQDEEQEEKEEEAADRDHALTIDDGSGLQKILTSQSRRRSRRKSALSDTGDGVTRRRSRATFDDSEQPNAPKKFTEEEEREVGAIKYKIYAAYIKACGGYSYWAFILFVFGLWVAVYLARSYWISIWTRSYRTESVFHGRLVQQSVGAWEHVHSRLAATELDPNLRYYLGVYLGISLLAWLIGTVRYFCVFVASIRASKTLFEKLAFAVLRAPLRWLDTVPLGRILNRFTSDFNMLDSRISMDLAFMLHNLMHVLSVVIAGIFVSPFMIVFAIALLVVSMYYAIRYLAGAREVKRLESNAKSPVFEQFGSVLTGIGTIRAFDKADAYLDRMFARIDKHCRAYWHLWLFNRWMGLRLNMVGAVFAAITAALIVSIRTIDSSLAGFALSFALGLSESVIWLLRQYSNVELDMNATERIVEYSNITIENQGGLDAPAAWPTEGKLEVHDLVVAYAPDLPPVLKGVTFSVSSNQRVGVVGRTGAGKSSLTLALFRFLEAQSGKIVIDGIDISTIKLSDLRSRLAIIPQDPVLFSGTVRSNLDAFNEHTDIELREALARVHLISSANITAGSSVVASGSVTPVRRTNADEASNGNADGGTHAAAVTANLHTNKNIFRSLNSKISEGGLNLSQGQRQLLCLARAIVSRPKIMVLDEATSAVDMETDALIQRSIREEFTDSTLLVIAHRLSTIADFDRILVLGEGKVVEFDTPANLLQKKDGVFREMVEMSGERAELEKLIRNSGHTGAR